MTEPLYAGIGEQVEQSASVWKQIAHAAFPDECPVLSEIRDLMEEKNRVFEEGEPDALERMLGIESRIRHLQEHVEEDLQHAATIVDNMRQLILKCEKIESEAIHSLAELNNG